MGDLQALATLRRETAPVRALAWIHANELTTGGIRVHSLSPTAYPEVTGYLVPTLEECGERELAGRLMRWLLCIQRADGSYPSPDGVPHIFDTGQVLRGLLAAANYMPQAHVPQVQEAARRAADYLCAQMVNGGWGGFGQRYAGDIPESVHLYVLPALHQATAALSDEKYRTAAAHCLDYYLHHSDALRLNELTHFLAYQLEALIDLGQPEAALPILDALRAQQQLDGAVRGVGSATWVCTPGLAQLAICWYKVGQDEAAAKALSWLEERQRSSGGFLGSYGPGATYFPEVELSWAVKFYLDAHRLRLLALAPRQVASALVAPPDGRAQVILACIKSADRVLQVGQHLGLSRCLQAAQPQGEYTCVSLAPDASLLPQSIGCVPGSLDNIPLADNQFDVVFAIESLRWTTNQETAVAAMLRVAKPGGWIVIIDQRMGHEKLPSWQQWPALAATRRWLQRGCDEVTVEPLGAKSHAHLTVWRGRKRDRLSGAQWNDVLISTASQNALLKRVRHNQISEWGQVIVLETEHGSKVLEIGSGTGEISLQLALAGRRVTALDVSRESLQFAARCAGELGVPLETAQADATQRLPFEDDAFDCTWSAGLLEHFTAAERQFMLREWARITSGKVINLVPNAASVAYRAGKARQEEYGAWLYGLEVPILTMREDFEAASLNLDAEFSIGARQALNFLPRWHPLRRALAKWMNSLSEAQLQNCNQGYLLVSIGTKQT